MFFLSNFRLILLFNIWMNTNNHVIKFELKQERKLFIIIIKNFKNDTSFYINNESMNNYKNVYLKIQIWIKRDNDEKVTSQNNKKNEITKLQKIILQWSCCFFQSWFLNECESIYKNIDMNTSVKMLRYLICLTHKFLLELAQAAQAVQSSSIIIKANKYLKNLILNCLVIFVYLFIYVLLIRLILSFISCFISCFILYS